MAEPLPTFPLSPRAIDLVIKYMENPDLLWLSTCSKNFYELVKSAIGNEDDNSSDTSRTNFAMSIELSSSPNVDIYLDNEESSPTFNFYGHRNPKRFEIIDEKQLNCTLYTDTTQRRIVCWKETEDTFGVIMNSIEDVLSFVEHMANVFNCFIDELMIAPELGHYSERIQSIPVLQNFNTVNIAEGTVSHEALRSILRAFSKKAALTLYCAIDRNFPFIDLMACDDTGRPDCSLPYSIAFNLRDSIMSNADVNLWLHRWMGSTCKQEWHVEIGTEHDENMANAEENDIYGDPLNQESWDMARIIEELETFPLVQDDVEFPGPPVTLIRESDGIWIDITIQSITKLVIDRKNPQDSDDDDCDADDDDSDNVDNSGDHGNAA